MTRTISALLAALALAVAVGPAAAGGQDQRNLVQTAAASGQFDTLATLLSKAGLAKTLQQKGPYTVFAPTDAAFAKVPTATVDERGPHSLFPDALVPELFLNAAGRAMTRSGFEYILAKHVAVATKRQPSIAGKRVTPHVLRHSCAMHTLQATGDVRKVALWLGHASLQSTEIYLRADPTEKLEALASMTPPGLRRGKFQAPDTLIAMLKAAGRS